MSLFLFILVSAAYVATIAAVDGLFNRLVFRELRTRSYFSAEKQEIYKLWEWRAIGLLYLIVLPVIIPAIVTWSMGGWRYLGVYAVVFLTVQWDVIFGKLVFDSWTGDTPSIALPFIGWKHVPLGQVVVGRLIAAAILTVVLWLCWGAA